jgi:hypothetical protein
MLPYNIVGIDPSFSRTGLCCVMQDGSKRVLFHNLSHPITGKASVDGTVKRGFHSVFESAFALANDVTSWVMSFDPVRVVMEEPLPASSMSPALYCLDSLIFERIKDHVLQTYNPSTLRTIHAKRDYTKTDSVNRATKLLERFHAAGWSVPIVSKTGKIRPPCHDCCEAFLYICHYLNTHGMDLKTLTF